jgi:hypothetical protein
MKTLHVFGSPAILKIAHKAAELHPNFSPKKPVANEPLATGFPSPVLSHNRPWNTMCRGLKSQLLNCHFRPIFPVNSALFVILGF